MRLAIGSTRQDDGGTGHSLRGATPTAGQPRVHPRWARPLDTGRTTHASVLASVAVYENEVRRERQLVGIANAKEKGVRFGPEPGTREGKRIKVTPEQEQAIRRMKAEGEKVAAIARATGLSRPTVYSVLDDGQ